MWQAMVVLSNRYNAGDILASDYRIGMIKLIQDNELTSDIMYNREFDFLALAIVQSKLT